ncbi:hypothetical protein V8E55_010203 [Tylopilus felleus]
MLSFLLLATQPSISRIVLVDQRTRGVGACPPTYLFLGSGAQRTREHAVCGDACPPLVLFLCFDLGLGSSEDVRIWRDVEYAQCVGMLVPLSCHLFLDSGAQRTRRFGGMLSMRSVWGRLSPSRAISWAQGLTEHADLAGCRERAESGGACPSLMLFGCLSGLGERTV